MWKVSRLFIFTLLLSVHAFSVNAQNLTKGLEAFETGDYVKAVEELVPLAEQGSAEAQAALGWIYMSGRNGVRRDYVESMKWFRLAADSGLADAQFGLGLFYAGGKGISQDYAEAAKWYILAANQGYKNAQTLLAMLYEKGNGVVQDYSEALKLYRLAAAQGDKIAQNRVELMEILIRNRATEQNVLRYDADAINSFRLAAAQGDAGAQHQLGLIYIDGLGVPQNYFLAYMWFNISYANGFDESKEWRDEYLAARMSAADIVKAQSAANDCLSSGYRDCGW